MCKGSATKPCKPSTLVNPMLTVVLAGLQRISGSSRLVVATAIIVALVAPVTTAKAAGGDALRLPKSTIVAAIESEDGKDRYQLMWAKTAWSWNQTEIFVTVHERDGDMGGSIASIYRRDGDAYLRLKRITSPRFRFLEPEFAWVQVGSDNSKEPIVRITERVEGTGAICIEHLFALGSDSDLKDVEFVSAPEAFAPHLRKGEGVWQGENNRFEDGRLVFTFHVWREGDANCCPTGGRVTGTYALEATEEGFRMVPSTFTWTIEQQARSHPQRATGQ
jgi:hypothetical protein